MKIFYPIFILLLVMCKPVIADDVLELFWEDMIPKGYEVPTDAPVVMHEGIAGVQTDAAAPVVTELNNKHVKIPGFVVPLDTSGDTIKEFLLVPFFGACIHVPPPPSNQIVHVTFEEPISMGATYDAVWIEGILSTDVWEGDIAVVGYRMEGISVSPFDG